jgi:uncharacterized membrane protein
MMTTPMVAAVLAPFVLWRMVSRVRRLTSRQRSKTWRHRTTLVFFPLLVLVLGAVSIGTAPIALAALVAGLPVGVLLGRVAIGKTRFEQVGDEYYFTPHAPIGLAVAALFMGRMAWRAWEFYQVGSFAHHEFVSSPLTLAIFGVLAGYYMSYAFGLLSWRKRTASI